MTLLKDLHLFWIMHFLKLVVRLVVLVLACLKVHAQIQLQFDASLAAKFIVVLLEFGDLGCRGGRCGTDCSIHFNRVNEQGEMWRRSNHVDACLIGLPCPFCVLVLQPIAKFLAPIPHFFFIVLSLFCNAGGMEFDYSIFRLPKCRPQVIPNRFVGDVLGAKAAIDSFVGKRQRAPFCNGPNVAMVARQLTFP